MTLYYSQFHFQFWFYSEEVKGQMSWSEFCLPLALRFFFSPCQSQKICKLRILLELNIDSWYIAKHPPLSDHEIHRNLFLLGENDLSGWWRYSDWASWLCVCSESVVPRAGRSLRLYRIILVWYVTINLNLQYYNISFQQLFAEGWAFGLISNKDDVEAWNI